MPPKNRGSSKKPAKARTPTLIDGLTKEELSKEQMEEHIVHLREELDREREERNYFQLERDKIHTFWEVTDRKLDEVKAELQNIEKEVEEDEGHHQVEIKVYKQKVKHLLCEHQNTVSELKADGLVSSQAMQKEQEQLETRLRKDMKSIMVDIQESDNENLIMELQLKHNEEMTEMRNRLDEQLAEITAKYEKKLELLPQELENMRKNVISESEDQWNGHIDTLCADHRKTFSETQEIADNIQRSLEMNHQFQGQIKDVGLRMDKKNEERLRLLDDNKRLAELLSKVKDEIAENERKMKCFTPKKNSNEKATQKQLDDLKRNYETLEQKFSQVQLERDELYKTFTENIQAVQQKAELKSTLLENKGKDVTDRLEATQARIFSVLSASNVDQTAFDGIARKVEESLDSSNNSIENLQHKIAQISQACKDLQLAH